MPRLPQHPTHSDSDSEEGFEIGGLKIIDIKPPELLPDTSLKLSDAKELISKRLSLSTSCIYTTIPLVPYSFLLDLPLEDSLVKMQKNSAHPHQVDSRDTRELWEYLKTNNLPCLYNKFNSRLDFRPEMTTFYKSFEYYLENTPSHSKQFTDKDSPLTENLEFSSNFECGNLQYVFGTQHTYHLLLHNDINTHGYSHWFFFRVRNKRKCKAKFLICNITKPIPLMRTAMGVSVFSLQQKSFCKKYWTEGGSNIRHYRNNFRHKTSSPHNFQQHFYSLQFDYEFKFQSDVVYFALNIPFTYTKMLHGVEDVKQRTRGDGIVMNVKTIGRTVSNNSIYVLEFIKKSRIHHTQSLKVSAEQLSNPLLESKPFTDISDSSSFSLPPPPSKKPSIVFMGRQHPCQTNSSYVLQGIINLLGSGSDAALYLLDYYDVYVIPMANPDGVVHGHSRVNLCGYDINREWGEPNKRNSNEVFVISNYLKHLNELSDIQYMVDFHSHSKKFNTFGYFCNDSPESKAFAWYLEYTNSNFDYSSCLFGQQKNKEKTFRYFASGLGVRNAMTVEVSYYGKFENGLYRRYTTRQLHELGVTLVKGICEFAEEGGSKVILNNYMKCVGERKEEEEGKEEELSDSDPEEDYLDERERVKVILEGRREKESSQPKNNKLSSLQRQRMPRRIGDLNKTMINLDREHQLKTDASSYLNKTLLTEYPQRPFKRYSQLEMLRDDSEPPSSPLRRRSVRGALSKQPEPKLYLWDQQKFNVPKVIAYPTSIHPYLQRLSSGSVETMDNSPLKKRLHHRIHTYSRSETQIETLIVDSRKRQNEKYKKLTEEEQRSRHKEGRRTYRRLLNRGINGESFKKLN